MTRVRSRFQLPDPGPWTPGVRLEAVVDPRWPGPGGRSGRPLPLAVWYPAAAGGRPRAARRESLDDTAPWELDGEAIAVLAETATAGRREAPAADDAGAWLARVEAVR